MPVDHDWRKMMEHKEYPDDLYDDEDYSVTKRISELRKEMYAHIIIGLGGGVMLTIATAMTAIWYMGL